MLFRKRRRPAPATRTSGSGPRGIGSPEPASYEITFDMMRKGAKVMRHGRTVRQATVMVNTNVILVTSGDTVDRQTYEALLAAEVIHPPQRDLPENGDEATDEA